MFEYNSYIKLHDTDAAGVMFFANQFKLVHDAYEAFLEANGLPLGELLAKADYLLPIVHAKTDYKFPLRVGEKFCIKLEVSKIGKSSFVLAHEITGSGSVTAGIGETVHVCIDRRTGEKIPVPPDLRNVLER